MPSDESVPAARKFENSEYIMKHQDVCSEKHDYASHSRTFPKTRSPRHGEELLRNTCLN